MENRKPTIKRLHASIPGELMIELQKRRLLANIDGLVANLLYDYLEEIDDQ